MTPELLQVTIPGEPQPKQRPRVVQGGTRTYTPTATVKAEHHIGWKVRQKYPGLQVDAESTFSVTVRFYTRRKLTDCDNCLNLTLDALNKIVWADDRQVTDLHAHLERDCLGPHRTELLIYRQGRR